MNERIKKLAIEAGIISAEYNGFDPTGLTKAQRKFAELIVQECVKVVDDMADPEDSERYFWAIQNASQKIKQHFGVEE